MTADESKVNSNGYFKMFASDGTHNIYVIDGETMTITGTLKVKDDAKNVYVSSINELEFANGFLYANVWYKDIILKIDPTSGNVVKQYDMSSLMETEKAFQIATYGEYVGDCLNGIAYDSDTDSFFLTGKQYYLVFKVKLS